MKQAVSLRGFSPAKQIAFTALFASLCCIGTVLIVVPLPASGYFNAGDIFVLLSAWCLGPLFGSVASAVGSALADIVSGFAIYAPATFLIKGLPALRRNRRNAEYPWQPVAGRVLHRSFRRARFYSLSRQNYATAFPSIIKYSARFCEPFFYC